MQLQLHAGMQLHAAHAWTHKPPMQRPQVNTYPCLRTFQAIGVADATFESDIAAAVEAVVGKIHIECVNSRPSSGGKYTVRRATLPAGSR